MLPRTCPRSSSPSRAHGNHVVADHVAGHAAGLVVENTTSTRSSTGEDLEKTNRRSTARPAYSMSPTPSTPLNSDPRLTGSDVSGRVTVTSIFTPYSWALRSTG